MKSMMFVPAFLVLVMGALVSSCGNDGPKDNPLESLSSVKLSVSDNGFLTDDGSSLYPVRFMSGERIGVFVVSDGKILDGCSNLCFVARENNDGELVWYCEESPESYPIDAEYYAYFPYAEVTDGDINPASDDALGFFAPLAQRWQVSMDQEELSDYRSCDLLVGVSSVESGNTVELSMQHAMGLVAVSLPMEYYSFTNADRDIPDYVLEKFSEPSFDGMAPYCPDGKTFVMVAVPGTSCAFSGSYRSADGEVVVWEEETLPVAGKCSFLDVNGGAECIEHELQPGDFFLADGRLLSRDAPASDVESADVIGIVFQTDPSRIDPEISDSLGTVHALVMSAKKAEGDNVGYFAWYCHSNGSYSRDETVIGFTNAFSSDSFVETYKMANDDIFGYKYNCALRTKRSGDLEAGFYPVFYAAMEFAAEVGAPSDDAPQNTGWYLPSNGEWLDFLRNVAGLELDEYAGDFEECDDGFVWGQCGSVVDKLNEAMANVSDECKDPYQEGGAYWTATTSGDSGSRIVSFNNMGYVRCKWYRKDLGYYARMALAF